MPRQRIVLGLGRLLEIPDVEQKILLTARINELIKGTPTLFNTRAPLKTTFFDAFVRIILRPFQHGNLQVLENISYISNMLLGVLIRQIIFSNRNKEMKTKLLFILDLVMLLADSIFGMFFPIIRNLWKGFFVLVTCGIFTLLLALFYLIIDVWGYRKYLFFFVVFGANSIAIYIWCFCLTSY